jgi:RNA polymerase sigma factor (sigma-70 family)
MTSGRIGPFLRRLRRLIGPDADSELSDAHLLRRFVQARDAAAFEVLVWRHGPMVFGVCRRLLRSEQDAEDAFQAAFLTLVRKARSIGRGEAVAGWLYRVACRIALRARADAAKRPRPAALDPDSLAAEPTPDLLAGDLRPALDEEVNRLPARYRTAFILCYLRGKTNAEAARELGCPPGTVATRLAWARERLRARLTRRGLSPFAGLLAPAAPRELVAAAVRAGVATAAGKAAVGAVPARAAAWSKKVVKAMFLTKLKVAAVVLAVGMLGAGAFLARPASQGDGRAADPPAAERPSVVPDRPAPDGPAAKDPPAAPPDKKDAPPDKETDRLVKARGELAAAEDEWEVFEAKLTEERVEARIRLLESQQRLAAAEDESTAARQEFTRVSGELRKMREVAAGGEALDRLKESAKKAVDEKMRTDKQLFEAQRELISAEESFRLFERRHAMRRDNARARLEEAREKVRQAGGGPAQADGAPDRRVRELEQKLEALRQEVGELLKELKSRPAGEKPRPPLGLPTDP